VTLDVLALVVPTDLVTRSLVCHRASSFEMVAAN